MKRTHDSQEDGKARGPRLGALDTLRDDLTPEGLRKALDAANQRLFAYWMLQFGSWENMERDQKTAAPDLKDDQPRASGGISQQRTRLRRHV